MKYCTPSYFVRSLRHSAIETFWLATMQLVPPLRRYIWLNKLAIEGPMEEFDIRES